MLFRELKESDIEFVAKHSISRGILSKRPQQIEWNYCLEHQGKILGIGGIQLLNLTTAWAWLDMTEFAEEHLISAYRVLKEWMEILCKDKGVKRLQVYTECGFSKAIRMVEHLGFHYEFTMPNFVGENPAYMFSRFFGDSKEQ